ncbi:MAG TPA: hypothetical protein VMV10_09620 [Pirellulales bacterium]|nr:hypothetical protein [Pirellulales bacterium]
MKDALGETVQPGCTVAYCSRKGARMWLRTLKVLSVSGNKISGLNRNGRTVTITREGGDDLIVAKGECL